jgi:hypothetical protein
MNTLCGPFGKNFWPCMQPYDYRGSSIAQVIKHRPVLITHNDSPGARNDGTAWPVKTLTQNL